MEFYANIEGLKIAGNEKGKVLYQSKVQDGFAVEEIRELETPLNKNCTHVWLRYWVEGDKCLVTGAQYGLLWRLVEDHQMDSYKK